jgi:hypothetical protein
MRASSDRRMVRGRRRDRRGSVEDPGTRVEAGFGEWLAHFGSRMALRFWGSIGWFDVHLPWWLMWVATVLLALAVCLGGVALFRRGPSRRRQLVVLSFPLVAVALAVAATSWERYVERASLGGIHGRYLFGGWVGLAVVAGLGLARAIKTRLGPPAVSPASAWPCTRSRSPACSTTTGTQAHPNTSSVR